MIKLTYIMLTCFFFLLVLIGCSNQPFHIAENQLTVKKESENYSIDIKTKIVGFRTNENDKIEVNYKLNIITPDSNRIDSIFSEDMSLTKFETDTMIISKKIYLDTLFGTGTYMFEMILSQDISDTALVELLIN